MLHAPPPPPCRADAVDWYIFARTSVHGLLMTMGLYTREACSLPARPDVTMLIGDRPARVRQRPLALAPASIPRRTIRPHEPATAVLRWKNWCGEGGPISLRLTLGGVTIVEQLGSATADPPVCVAPSSASTLGVSLFVRR